MSNQVNIQKRINQLRERGANLDDILKRIARDATLRAIEEAQNATPPKKGTGRGPYIGANMITGELKASWAEHSETNPQRKGNDYVTKLVNKKDYASYVNDGHRMKRHFVPGLYIDKNGNLSYDPAMAAKKKGGLMVGTKTRYVKGEFMVDKAKDAYDKTVISELDKEIEALFK